MKNNLNLSKTFSPCLKSITTLCLASTFIFMTCQAQAAEEGSSLSVPKSGKIRVAFAVTQHGNVIDLTSAWEVFQDVTIEKDGKTYSPFELFVVSDNLEPVTMTGGLQLLPQYTFENAPQPHVISVGAQMGGNGLIQWLKKTAPKTDLTMSICTGAFQLAAAGLLDGLKATTHHDFFDTFEKKYPKLKLQRGFRFVEGAENIATAGGLTSGFDMALRVVERYFGKKVADKTAYYMEFQRGTKNNIGSGASQQTDGDDTKVRGGVKEDLL